MLLAAHCRLLAVSTSVCWCVRVRPTLISVQMELGELFWDDLLGRHRTEQVEEEEVEVGCALDLTPVRTSRIRYFSRSRMNGS